MQKSFKSLRWRLRINIQNRFLSKTLTVIVCKIFLEKIKNQAKLDETRKL